MLSAVNIDGLDKMELREHFFNDVKYATISLNKDLRQMNEKYKSDLLTIDFLSTKKRLQEEYSIFGKPTYEFLNLAEFSLDQEALAKYLNKNHEQLISCLKQLSNLNELSEKLSMYGLNQNWTYGKLLEFLLVFEQIDPNMIPTKYWFELNKYDFIQELMNETQTKVEEFLFSQKRVLLSWNPQIFEEDKVAALDYYIERKDAGMKLFDLNYHKCKKILKDLFQDEARTLKDSEIEDLHKHIYVIKRHEYWLSRNQTRIKQFLGDGYQGIATDFVHLRSQYAIINKLCVEYTVEEERKIFATSMLEKDSYVELSNIVKELHGEVMEFDREKLTNILPCDSLIFEQYTLCVIFHVIHSFASITMCLSRDLDQICQYRLEDKEEFQIEDLRKAIYLIERIVQKQDWLKKHHAKIRELFRNEELSMETDWNAMRDKLFNTDLTKCFQTYEIVDKDSCIEQSGGQLSINQVLPYVLYIESPIKEEVLYRRVVSLLEATRLTPKMKQEIQALLQCELANEYKKEEEYIYSKDNTDYALRLPKEGERREIDLIAPREIKAGIIKILEIHYEMTMDDIGKELAKLLGYPRRTKKYNDIFEKYVKELQREGKIKRFSGGFRIENC